MTLEEKLALNRKILVLDPLNNHQFVDYDFWAKIISQYCKEYTDDTVSIHFTHTSKCQTFRTKHQNKEYIVIDENHIYLLCRYAAMVLQIAYANNRLEGQERDDLIENAKKHLDVLYNRYEATFFIYSDSAALIWAQSLEFIAAQDAVENLGKEHLDFNRLLNGEGAETYNEHLKIITDILYLWVVLHEVAHCAFKKNPDYLVQVKGAVKETMQRHVSSLDPETEQQKIQLIHEVLASESSVEEMACDHFAIDNLMYLLQQKYKDPKLVLMMFNAAWAIMDYDQQMLNVMRGMNSLLSLYNPERDSRNEYVDMIRGNIRSFQIEHIVRQEYVSKLRFSWDAEIFPSKDEYVPELESMVRSYNSAATDLREYASDFTSGHYLSNFFGFADSVDGKDSSAKESMISLFQWDLDIYSDLKDISAGEIANLDEKHFRGYVKHFCSITHSLGGNMVLGSSEKLYSRLVTDVISMEDGGFYSDVAVYTEGSYSDNILDDLYAYNYMITHSKLPTKLRAFVNCPFEQEVIDKLREEKDIQVIDINGIRELTKTIRITFADVENATTGIQQHKYKELNNSFDTTEAFVNLLTRYDPRMAIYGKDIDTGEQYALSTVYDHENEDAKFLIFLKEKDNDDPWRTFALRNAIIEEKFESHYMCFEVEEEDDAVIQYGLTGDLSCDIDSLRMFLHIEKLDN
ncbi:hypothetical protein LJC45_03585 [Alistipes sp. OttesenSCG-928-B03]|nr:hypothetical protein [Alistipes sp. OttesenSCG-928-B03]